MSGCASFEARAGTHWTDEEKPVVTAEGITNSMREMNKALAQADIDRTQRRIKELDEEIAKLHRHRDLQLIYLGARKADLLVLK